MNSRIVYFVQHKLNDRSRDREVWRGRSERTCVELVMYVRSTAIERLSSTVILLIDLREAPGETGRSECVPRDRASSRAYNRTVP